MRKKIFFVLGYGTPKFQSAGIGPFEWAVAKGGTADGSLLPERPIYNLVHTLKMHYNPVHIFLQNFALGE